VLSLKHRNSFKPSCFDCFIYSKYYTGIFSPESSGSFYIRSFSHIYIASFAPASSVVQSRQLMRPLSAALASREVLQDPRHYRQAIYFSEHEQYYKHTSRHTIITLKYYRYSGKSPREPNYTTREYRKDSLL
jgi:hypothetical protein